MRRESFVERKRRNQFPRRELLARIGICIEENKITETKKESPFLRLLLLALLLLLLSSLFFSPRSGVENFFFFLLFIYRVFAGNT